MEPEKISEKNFVAYRTPLVGVGGRESRMYTFIDREAGPIWRIGHMGALTTGLILHWDHKPVEERTKESTEDATGVVLEWDFWYMNRVPKV